MSTFYCDIHDRLEDSDIVGFNEVGELLVCDEAVELQYDKGWQHWKNVHGETFRYQPCCNKVRREFCVCNESHYCEDHGHKCHGTHD